MFWCRPFFSNKQNEKKKIIITIIPTNKQNKKRGKEKRDLYCSYILDVSYFLSLSLCRVAVIIYFVCVYRRLWSNWFDEKTENSWDDFSSPFCDHWEIVKKKKISEARRLVATFSFRCEFESVSASLSLFLLFILPFLHPFFHVAHVTSARNPLWCASFAYTNLSELASSMSATMQFIYIHTMYPLRCVTWSSEYHDEWKTRRKRAHVLFILSPLSFRDYAQSKSSSFNRFIFFFFFF